MPKEVKAEVCTKFQCGTLCKSLWWRHMSWRLGLAAGSFGRREGVAALVLVALMLGLLGSLWCKQNLYKALCKDPSFPATCARRTLQALQAARNSSFTRVRNRCIFSGRNRAVYETFRMSVSSFVLWPLKACSMALKSVLVATEPEIAIMVSVILDSKDLDTYPVGKTSKGC
ncbi:mitochondrial ribosomal protein S14 [Prunus dulcis]|uniref:Small ribosomal subunit protein uS14m n=1 Tax=Prunus dulcis TaxID=3755 RepID=A0A5H2XJM7_PRUDU|nr:mitochondrial ribosomal protein S14 [Prunus dulcis]